MPEATQALFERLNRIEPISNFLLIGGTALSINEKHRLSEDLDFCTTRLRLNRHIVRQIIDSLVEQGCNVSLQENLEARHDFEDAGLDINDYHRDYAVDGVKLTFFTVEAEERAVLESVNPATLGLIRVADTNTLFRLKAILLTKRITKRDLFDIHFLLLHRKYPFDELISTINQHKHLFSYEALSSQLLTAKFHPSDPGYLPLVDTEISVEQLRKDIEPLVSKYEQDLARTQLEEELKLSSKN